MRLPKIRQSVDIRRAWYKFSRNRMSIAGLVLVLLIAIAAAFAPIVAPYPEHSGRYVNFREASQPPSLRYLCGTDTIGRDVLSRIIFGYRTSLLLGIVVLSIAVPIGVCVGLIGGYTKNYYIRSLIMRVTDIFLSIPPLILALAVASTLKPSLTNSMMAISLMWWPWYARLVYSVVGSVRNEFFIQAAEVIGASRFHILFRELLPNCISPILTKVTLDMGFVILIGASLSFVGLGAQPPTPDLGTMVADGAKYLPGQWWMAVFPALAIVLVVLGFNLLGDGLRDLLALEEI